MIGKIDRSPVPRNGHTLVVSVVARISGCVNQKELRLEDQQDHAREVVGQIYEVPTDYRIVATKGKGEDLTRPELDQIEAMLRARELDLMVVEDIGRLVRGVEASRICGIAVDHGTRVLAPNDCIDTADDSWEEDVISACRDHVGHNSHGSKRINQKKMNRFKKFGGATPCESYGLSQAAQHQDLRRLEEGRGGHAGPPRMLPHPEGDGQLHGRGRLSQHPGATAREILPSSGLGRDHGPAARRESDFEGDARAGVQAHRQAQ